MYALLQCICDWLALVLSAEQLIETRQRETQMTCTSAKVTECIVIRVIESAGSSEASAKSFESRSTIGGFDLQCAPRHKDVGLKQ